MLVTNFVSVKCLDKKCHSQYVYVYAYMHVYAYVYVYMYIYMYIYNMYIHITKMSLVVLFVHA